MVPPREFLSNLIGALLSLISMLLCLGVFAIAYLPTFGGQPIAQQITIVSALVMAGLYMLGVLGMIIASLMAERPR